MRNLEVKHLAPYLPYHLKCQIKGGEICQIDTLQAVYNNAVKAECVFFNIVESNQGFDSVKPILRPLSDLKDVIEVNSSWFIPIEVLQSKGYDINDEWIDEVFSHILLAPYDFLMQLIEWHFDVFGLIEQDLAIDINKL